MQATQSSDASNRTMPEFRSDSTTMRIFPSPFSAPIQAARKYLERQRGDAPQSLGIVSKIEEQAPSRQDGQLTARSEDMGDEASGIGVSRDQDRRLERSLYEGHSIEAGLNLEGVVAYDLADDLNDGAGVARAYLSDGDGTEQPFSYAFPGPSPNPEQVRGAISRLARESELRPQPAAEKPFRSLDFGEVARRVWGADVSLAETTAPFAAQRLMEAGIPARDSNTDGLQSEVSMQAVAVEDQSEIRPMNRAAGFDHAENGQSCSGNPPADLSGDSYESGFVRAIVSAGEASAASECDVQAEPALAHDACNLLSALALYSELLASPGVLGEGHRRYAEEMRLLAGRSHTLIDRLLRVSGKRPAQAFPVGVKLTSAREPLGVVSKDASLPKAASSLGRSIGNGSGSCMGEAALPETPSEEVADFKALVLDPLKQPTPVDTLLSKAGVGAGEVPATNMMDLLMRWGSLLSTLAQGTLEIVFGPNAATPVPVEAEGLERILVNLVRNARAATIQGGAIRISAGTSDADSQGGAIKSMVLTVDDSGCGMTEAQVNRLLGGEDGLHDHQTSAPSDGSSRRGLGLQIVRQLAAASGGTVSIESAPGKGTRVEMRWPLQVAASRNALLQEEQARSFEAPMKQEGIADLLPIATRSALPTELLIPMPVNLPEVAKSAVGPDGYNETELRAMMLRLHRGGVPERSPFSRRLSNRAAGGRETAHGFGTAASSVARSDTDGSVVETDSSQNNRALKGAIAC